MKIEDMAAEFADAFIDDDFNGDTYRATRVGFLAGCKRGLEIAIRLCSQENDIFSLPVLVQAIEEILDGKMDIPEEVSGGE